MSNKALYVVIAVLVIVIAIGAAYFILKNKEVAAPETQNQTDNIPTNNTPLSEQPNQAKFNEYFSNISLVNIPQGTQLGPGMNLKKTSVFDFGAGDRFCTSMDVVKEFPTSILNQAIYNVDSKSYAIPKGGGGGPSKLGTGNSTGCQDLLVAPNTYISAGNYEYKVYMDNVLVAVIPFVVK